MKRLAILCAVCWVASAQESTALVDRVGTTGFIQLNAESFKTLTPKQKELAYWLTQASIAINPIIYDQLSRFGLRQKQMLELVLNHRESVDPLVYDKVVSYTKLFWANRGNHNEQTAQKFLPDFTIDEFQKAVTAAHGSPTRSSSPS